MRVATWNIWWGYISSDTENIFDTEDIHYFAEELKRMGIDVVCLQEVHADEESDQAKTIAKELGYGFYKTIRVSDSHLKEGQKLSIAIISRYPIVSSQFHPLPNPNLEFVWNGKQALSHDKWILEVITDIENKHVRFISLHLVPFQKFGRSPLEEEFTTIRENIERVVINTTLPTVIGGDFNFNDAISLLPNLLKYGYRSILPDEATTPREWKYDKIWISEHWNYTKNMIIHGKADHYLCFSEVRQTQ